MKITLRVAIIIIGLPLFYFVISLIGATIPASKTHIQGHAKITIGLLSGAIHTDILLPLDKHTRHRFEWLANDIPIRHNNAQWLGMGWGAKEFYTNTASYSDLSFSNVAKAVTGDASVMHVFATDFTPSKENVKWLTLSQVQYDTLIAELTKSFKNGRDTAPIGTKGYTQYDRFYPAQGRFNIFTTCNVWVGKMLRRSGVIFGIWTPTPHSITLSHALHVE